MEEDFVAVGLLNYIDQNYKTALENFNKAVNINADNSEAVLFRGIALLKLGNYDKAINDFNKSESLNSKSGFELNYNRGLAYLFNSEIAFAKSNFEAAKKQASDSQLKLVNKYLQKL